MIERLVVDLYMVAITLQPFMPDTSRIILEAIKENKKPEKENLGEQQQNQSQHNENEIR